MSGLLGMLRDDVEFDMAREVCLEKKDHSEKGHSEVVKVLKDVQARLGAPAQGVLLAKLIRTLGIDTQDACDHKGSLKAFLDLSSFPGGKESLFDIVKQAKEQDPKQYIGKILSLVGEDGTQWSYLVEQAASIDSSVDVVFKGARVIDGAKNEDEDNNVVKEALAVAVAKNNAAKAAVLTALAEFMMALDLGTKCAEEVTDAVVKATAVEKAAATEEAVKEAFDAVVKAIDKVNEIVTADGETQVLDDSKDSNSAALFLEQAGASDAVKYIASALERAESFYAASVKELHEAAESSSDGSDLKEFLESEDEDTRESSVDRQEEDGAVAGGDCSDASDIPSKIKCLKKGIAVNLLAFKRAVKSAEGTGIFKGAHYIFQQKAGGGTIKISDSSTNGKILGELYSGVRAFKHIKSGEEHLDARKVGSIKHISDVSWHIFGNAWGDSASGLSIKAFLDQDNKEIESIVKLQCGGERIKCHNVDAIIAAIGAEHSIFSLLQANGFIHGDNAKMQEGSHVIKESKTVKDGLEYFEELITGVEGSGGAAVLGLFSGAFGAKNWPVADSADV